MKYILIGLLLASCTGSPAYAKDACEILRDAAFNYMLARQQGADYDKVVAYIKKNDYNLSPEAVEASISLVQDVFRYPVKDSEKEASIMVVGYSENVYLICMDKNIL